MHIRRNSSSALAFRAVLARPCAYRANQSPISVTGRQSFFIPQVPGSLQLMIFRGVAVHTARRLRSLYRVNAGLEVCCVMKMTDLIRQIGIKVLTSGAMPDAEIKRIYAGDRISDFLSQGGTETLLVTNLSGGHILRAAKLMDVPAICLLNGISPEPELTTAAERNGIVLLVSSYDMFGTCGRFYGRFAGAGEMRQ